MWTYIVRRAIMTVPVLVLISIVTFFTVRLLPGDIARNILGPEAEPSAVEALRENLGLNKNVFVQYGEWVGNALQGDFGESIRSGEPIVDLIANRLPLTIELGILAMAIALVIGIPLGIIAGSRPNTPFDYFSTFFAVLGAAIPNFWLAMMLILLFSIELGWLPALGWTSFLDDPVKNLKSLLLPALAIGVFQAAVLARQTRASLVEVLRQDYVRTAQAKGLRERTIIVRHGLRNALIPIVTVMGLQLSQIVSGAIIIETVFALPGIGKLVIDSILFRELPAVQAIALLIAASVSIANLAVDVVYAYLDPRIRYE